MHVHTHTCTHCEPLRKCAVAANQHFRLITILLKTFFQAPLPHKYSAKRGSRKNALHSEKWNASKKSPHDFCVKTLRNKKWKQGHHKREPDEEFRPEGKKFRRREDATAEIDKEWDGSIRERKKTKARIIEVKVNMSGGKRGKRRRWRSCQGHRGQTREN